MKPTTINTRDQIVRIQLKRGAITIGPGRQIGGLWELVRKELITNEQTRKLCGNITRHTLIRWRSSRGFPPPVTTVRAAGGDVELWSRTQVEEWKRQQD